MKANNLYIGPLRRAVKSWNSSGKRIQTSNSLFGKPRFNTEKVSFANEWNPRNRNVVRNCDGIHQVSLIVQGSLLSREFSPPNSVRGISELVDECLEEIRDLIPGFEFQNQVSGGKEKSRA